MSSPLPKPEYERIRKLEAALAALRQRHGEAIKDAYVEGYLRADWPEQDRHDAEDAWLDSHAKAATEAP